MQVCACILFFYVISLIHIMRINRKIIMAVLNPPKLPSMFINRTGKGKYAYVMVYKSVWDKEKKNSRRVGSEKVGSIIGGQADGEVKFNESFIDKYPDLVHFKVFHRNKKFEFEAINEELYTVKNKTATTSLHAGATFALDCIVRPSPVWKALSEVFAHHATAHKLLSLAYYMVLNANNTMHYYDVFAEKTWLPYQKIMSESTISRLLQKISADDIERFLSRLTELYIKEGVFKTGKELFVALDSSSISTYSTLLSKAEYGKNKDGVNLRQINILMLVEQMTGLPIYYRLYDGDVPDVSTVRNTIASHCRLFDNDENKFVFVTDRGYISNANIDDFIRNNLSFVTNTRVASTKFIQTTIDKYKTNFTNPNYYNRFINQYVFTEEAMWDYDSFPVKGRKQQKKDKIKVFLHMYYDRRIYESHLETITFNLTSVRDKILEQKELLPYEQKLREDYIIENDKSKDVTINIAKVEEHLKYAGFRVLLTDTVKDPILAHRIYSERNCVEYAFNTLKSRLSCNRFGVSNNRSLEGKAFVQFLATSISTMVRNRLADYELKHKDAKDRFTLNDKSDRKVLDLMNNVMVTKFNEGFIFSEVVGQRKRLFEALGVPVPTVIQSKEQELEEELCTELDEINSVDELMETIKPI